MAINNVIEHAQVFQNSLDKAAVEQATSGWMELNEDLVKYSGGNKVKIPSLDMDGLGDYTRNKGFAEGSVSITWEEQTFTQDRGRQFAFDEHEVDETNFLLTASTVMGEFQREHVVPEIDAYRYSRIAAKAIEKNKTSTYTPAEASIMKELYKDIAAVADIAGEVPLVITMSTKVAAMLSMNETVRKTMDVMDFTKGDITLKVQAIDGIHPIIRVGSGRLKTAYEFYDGETTGQEKGGFTPAAGAKDINWIICPRSAPIAVSRTDKVRIFDPETYQKMRSWSMDYRKFHDLWLTKKALDRVHVSLKG